MSEGTPINRPFDPDYYDRKRSSEEEDIDAGYGGAAPDSGPDDPDIDAEELRSTDDDDRRAAFGGSISDQDDRDAEDAGNIALRLTREQ